MTYSIIGRDPSSGETGIAVQSRWFHAGQDLAWIDPGVGAVCTQAILEPTYGPLGLELMRHGRSSEQALVELTRADAGREQRQVAMLDTAGRFAQHTGSACVAEAGHATGQDCCAQGNMLARETCWGAMADAFERPDGDLADRLLAALDAAEREGGDARGRQAAAILVRPAQATGVPWQDRVLDLRVADHAEPVGELRRLVDVKRGYDRLGHAFRLVEQRDFEAAAGEADAALALAPEDDQIAFWRATIIAGAGRVEEAVEALGQASERHRAWPDFLRRCVAAGLLPAEAEALVSKAR